jgi:mxaJ protein
VEHGDIDVAAAWGPLAGYAAKTSRVPLNITPISGGERFAPLRFQFDIAMGVRKGNDVLRDQLDDFIVQNAAEITALLKSFGVPLIENNLSAASGDQAR